MGPAVQGSGGHIVSKWPLLLLLWGSSRLQGPQLGWLALVGDPNNSKERIWLQEASYVSKVNSLWLLLMASKRSTEAPLSLAGALTSVAPPGYVPELKQALPKSIMNYTQTQPSLLFKCQEMNEGSTK